MRFCVVLTLLTIHLAGLHSEEPALSRSVKNLGYSVSNLDQEIAQLKQRTQNQEAILDSMHKEVSALIKSAKEQQKSTGAQVDTRLKNMEKNFDKFVSDLKQFKKFSDEASDSFTKIHKQLAEQEQVNKLQAQQIKELESALRLLVKAVQGKGSDTKEYTVKAGDTLDKIAKEHGTTIDAIKKQNSLTKDVIYPAQKLEIP